MLRAERRGASPHSFITIWVVLSNFEVGVDGQLVMHNVDALSLVRTNSYSPDLGPWGVQLWPLASVSALQPCNEGARRRSGGAGGGDGMGGEETDGDEEEQGERRLGWKVDAVFDDADGRDDVDGHRWEIYQGMEVKREGFNVGVSDRADCANSGVLVELLVYESWNPGHGDCRWEPVTVSLEDGDGDPFEGHRQLSQLHILRPCTAGQVPHTRVERGLSVSLAGLTNVERRTASDRGLAVLLQHPHHAASSLNAASTCYWYAGPLPGGEEWAEHALGEELGRARREARGAEREERQEGEESRDRQGRQEGEERQENEARGERRGRRESPAEVGGGGKVGLCGFADILIGGVRLGSAAAVPRIVGFYHVSTVGERWPSVVGRQLQMLRTSPLYNAMDQIRVGASGWFADVVPTLLPHTADNRKFSFVDHNSKDKYTALGGSHVAREVPTLQLMFEHCRAEANGKDWVWYMHSKGVGHTWPKFKWTQDWTVYMEAFLFEQPQLCMHALQSGANACGVELYHSPFLHYAGNFWWTTCERVRGLEEPDGMLPMTQSTWGRPENWIGSARGGRMMSLFSAYESNPYGTDLPRSAYMPIATGLQSVQCPQCPQSSSL